MASPAHPTRWLRPTLNLLLMVKKNQGWRSVCLGRPSGAPMRNAGETVRVASACELSADMPPTPQRTISISRAQGFSCVSCRVRFARAPLFFWLFLHLSTSSSWTRSRHCGSSSRFRICGSLTDDWPATSTSTAAAPLAVAQREVQQLGVLRARAKVVKS